MKTIKRITKFITTAVFAAYMTFVPAYGQTSYKELAEQQQNQQQEEVLKTQRTEEAAKKEQERKAQEAYNKLHQKIQKTYTEYAQKKEGLETYVVGQIKDSTFDDREIDDVVGYFDDLKELHTTLRQHDSMLTDDQRNALELDTTLLERINCLKNENDTVQVTSYFQEKGVNVKVEKAPHRHYYPTFLSTYLIWRLLSRRREEESN
jgi:hypothetical protein